jgi:hypothetical protein
MATLQGLAGLANRRATLALSRGRAPLQRCLSSTEGAQQAQGGGEGVRYQYFIPQDLVAEAPATVQRALSLATADAKEMKRAAKRELMARLTDREGNTGYTPVQGRMEAL